MIFKNPEKCDIPRLKLLWKEVFGDSDSFIKGFFSVAFAAERARVAVADDNIVAALYIFDCSCDRKKLAYIYAVQTDPAFRGRGICRSLFEDTHRYLKEKGYSGVILVPSGEALEEMYEKFGYYTFAEGKKITVRAGTDKLLIWRVNTAKYERTREEMLDRYAVLQQGVSTQFLALSEELYESEYFLLAAHREEDRLIVTEFLGNDSLLPDIVYTLGLSLGEYKTPRAMYCPFDTDSPTPTYFGLSFE